MLLIVTITFCPSQRVTSSQRLLTKDRITGADFLCGKVNMIPASLEQCSRLQQSLCCCCRFFAAYTTAVICSAFQLARQFQQLPLLLRDLDPRLLHVFWAHPSLQPSRYLDQFSYVCRLMNVTNRWTDRHTNRSRYPVCSK